MIVSETAFVVFVTTILGVTCVVWAIRDAFFLRRVRRDEVDPVIRRDKIFGALIGMTIGVLGIVGVLRYHL